ncbi:hypothetical protein Barb7_02016 [Bacteroidales bacterium Barb7]|nr:hypothetical protein Barb7_02016 [Bacteroidales bacterium Barb7]
MVAELVKIGDDVVEYPAGAFLRCPFRLALGGVSVGDGCRMEDVVLAVVGSVGIVEVVGQTLYKGNIDFGVGNVEKGRAYVLIVRPCPSQRVGHVVFACQEDRGIDKVVRVCHLCQRAGSPCIGKFGFQTGIIAVGIVYVQAYGEPVGQLAVHLCIKGVAVELVILHHTLFAGVGSRSVIVHAVGTAGEVGIIALYGRIVAGHHVHPVDVMPSFEIHILLLL